MESLVFLIALGVVSAVMAWFIANEAAGASGEKGLLSIRADVDVDGGTDQTRPAARYRLRDRPTPGRLRSVAGPAPKRAYRLKAEVKPRNDGAAEGAASLADDF